MKRGGWIERRYRSLLQVNAVALNSATSEAVFRGMCIALKRLVPYERAALALYDPDHDALKIVDLYGPYENSSVRVGQLLSREDTQSGWAFDHKRPLFRRDLEKESRFVTDKEILQEGYRSMCSVPLMVLGHSIGVVTVTATKKNQLSMDHAEAVQEMSNQIALAINCNVLRCATHTGTKLVCPRCIGAAGGQATVAKHREYLSSWGKKGGRGKKRSD